jgi:DNA replication protein DnaC
MDDSKNQVCGKHGEYIDEGVMVGDRMIFRRCPACNREYHIAAQEAKAKAEAARKVELAKRLHESSLIPKRFKSCSFENFVASNEGQTKALATAKAYADSWEQMQERGAGLIFSGKAGTGKTHLACAIANAVIDLAVPAKFTTVTNMMRAIKETYSKDSDDSESKVLQRLSDVPLLVMDEAGMDYGTDFNKTLLFEVLNSRYENVNPTIILTNLDATALKEYLGERVVDRMRDGGGKLVTFNWESQRK